MCHIAISGNVDRLLDISFRLRRDKPRQNYRMFFCFQAMAVAPAEMATPWWAAVIPRRRRNTRRISSSIA